MAMKNQHGSLTPAQLEILSVLWDKGETGISEIAAELNKRRVISRQNIMIQVLRLERRKWLKRRREGLAYRYRPTRSRAEVAGAMAVNLVETGFGGSTEHLVKTLLDARGITAAELERLRKLIDDAELK